MDRVNSYFNNNKTFFESPLGIMAGVDRSGGASVDGLFDLGSVSYVELGPVTIDPQYQPSIRTNLINIRQGPESRVDHLFTKSRYSCAQLIYNLTLRQERIRDLI